MKKLIIIKYGELTTKHDNINYFIKMLKDNIDNALKDIEHQVSYDIGRMFIETEEFDKVVSKITKVFGIHEINIGYELNDTNIDNISISLLDLLKNKEFNYFC